MLHTACLLYSLTTKVQDAKYGRLVNHYGTKFDGINIIDFSFICGL